ncbi:MAG: ABC transporter ATP-binding protein [Proteobacteria bacterium]|nr:ABC transporter ATP-binding protein [Pseudomonadota bacterium]
MSQRHSRSMGLGSAVRVLYRSASFRDVTSRLRGRLILTAAAISSATLAGLYAIDAQAKFLGFGRQDGQTLSGRISMLFAVFVGAQLLFEILQWLRRSCQNQVSVSASHHLRMLIYENYRSLKYCELQTLPAGEVAQLHASDSSLLAGVWSDGLLSFLTTLVLTLGVSIFLTVQIGAAGCVFFIVLLLLIYLAQRFSRQMAPALQKRAIYSSQRLSVIQESVRSVQLVKSLTAEKDFAGRVEHFLNLEQEMKLLSNQISCRYVPVFASLRWLAWAGVLLWIIYSPALTQVQPNPYSLVALVFAVNWYSSLLQDSFLFVGTYLSSVQVGAVSAQRIDGFLSLKAAKPQYVLPAGGEQADIAIGLSDASVEYPTRRGLRALDGISLSVRRGQFVAVIGPVGSGKSTVLRAMLGELPLMQGKVIRNEGLKVGYLPQDVVIPSSTLRDALRFQFDNSAAEDEALLGVLDAAGFRPDLASLSAGLGTAIGERGVTLSGGQRLRVGLAQLAYFKDAEVLLLDDPLAALDAATADLVTSNLIGGLWAKKTRVVTTHRLELARRADWVVRMEGGRVVEQGPPECLNWSDFPS